MLDDKSHPLARSPQLILPTRPSCPNRTAPATTHGAARKSIAPCLRDPTRYFDGLVGSGRSPDLAEWSLKKSKLLSSRRLEHPHCRRREVRLRPRSTGTRWPGFPNPQLGPFRRQRGSESLTRAHMSPQRTGSRRAQSLRALIPTLRRTPPLDPHHGASRQPSKIRRDAAL
jgi:hypothetical protein